jgi:hypothetical protein
MRIVVSTREVFGVGALVVTAGDREFPRKTGLRLPRATPLVREIIARVANLRRAFLREKTGFPSIFSFFVQALARKAW